MKIQFLGTAAAEAQPGLFCDCPTCTYARQHGGKDVRTRSQSLIDDALLLDFSADTMDHCIRFGMNLSTISHCLITHSHSDHLYLNDLSMRMPDFSNMGEDRAFHLYGSEGVMQETAQRLEQASGENAAKYVKCHGIPLYEAVPVGDYMVTSFKALHGNRDDFRFYMIENKEGKRLLYAHDTDYFEEEVWEYFEKNKPYFSFVSLDCTEANLPWMHYTGHMNLANNKKVKDRLIEIGCADENTLFCCNHFSHNGIDVLYDPFSKLAEEQGFITSYDGLTVEF